MRPFFLSRWWLLVALSPGSLFSVLAAKIVLIAGPITGHPKEAHEYEKCIVLLKELIETSPNLPVHPQVELHFDGWPANPATLDDADTIVLISDGGDHREQDHPLYVGDRREQFARQMKRGCGCVFLHWSTFHPARFHDDTTEWAGGYFDYETGATANHWYSAIQTWMADAIPQRGHPVTRGVHPYRAQEEFYYRLKFREGDTRLTSLLQTHPPGETNDFTVAWAVERKDGGRGFGTTGGHFFTNYWQPDFRRLVLNAMVWTAKLEVPADGVESLPMDRFRALVVTGANHPAHDWRAVTGALLPVLEQDPRAIVTVTENPEDLARSGFLEGYDLLVWNYVNWERKGLSSAARAYLLDYLHRGGGLSLIHFGASAFHPSVPGTGPEDSWPEWYEHIAARVWEHRPPTPSGHDSFGPFSVQPTSVSHPITDGLAPFDTVDELYFHQVGGVPAEALVTGFSKVTGTNEPLAWACGYGSARIFETVLGHGDVSIRAAAPLIRRGSVWAAWRPPLGFDPPKDRLDHVLWRDGSSWTPAASAAKARLPISNSIPVLPGRIVRAVESAVGDPVVPPVDASGYGAPAAPAPVQREVSTNAGIPKISGKDSAAQVEADWVDNRWQQSDVGPFLASNLRFADGIVARGLTIRITDKHEVGAVTYDTATGALQAAWTGGFLTFDPGRFGLIGPPSPGGTNTLFAPRQPTWYAGDYRYLGLHRSGNRAVLDYSVHGIRVLESPGLKSSSVGPIVVRQFWVGAHSHPLQFFVQRSLSSTNGHLDAAQTPSERPFGGTRRGYGSQSFFWLATRSSSQAVVAALISDSLGSSSEGGAPVGAPGPSLGGAPGGSFGSATVRPVKALVPQACPGGWSVELPATDQSQSFALYSWQGDPWQTETLLTELDYGQLERDDRPASVPLLPSSLISLVERMPSQWTELTTQGQLGMTNDLLAVDTLTLPYDNPFHALMFASGIDFGERGTAYICTIHGDVWKVTGIDDTLHELKWHRFATGLFQPLGLRVRDGKVLVLGRDRITRLHDFNQDGEADFYENFNDSMETSTGGHDYVTCLEVDAAGNLYYTDPKGVHRVSPDGRSQSLLASGWRNPNGLGVRPDGLITVAPQQGTWTPSSQISEVRNGGYYGYPGPRVTPERPLGYDVPLCWIPHSVDNSSGSQVWLPSGVWGPLGGHMLHLLWGRCGLMAVLRDTVGKSSQGAVLLLPAKFLSGPNRATFNPQDGALYVAGSTGWQTSAVRDGALQRVRWLGHPATLPVGWHAHNNGLEISFSQPVKRDTAEDVGSYAIQQWNYRYSSEYGSKDWSVAHPDQEGHDEVAVRSAHLSPDGRTVFLETDPLHPVMQMEVKWNLDAADGGGFQQKIWLTLNELDTAWSVQQ